MEPNEPGLDPDAVEALLTELVRCGIIPEAAVLAAIENMTAAGKSQAAQELRALLIYGSLPGDKQRQIAERRGALRIVSDGGNPDD